MDQPLIKKEMEAMRSVDYAVTYTRDQVELLKRTVARGASDDELKLFLYTAKRTGLDPLLKQIHAVKRWDSNLGGYAMTIQTGIDGYRLIAERTKRYVPGREPTFVETEGKLVSATSYIKKFSNGQWHEIAATAFYDEYVQKKKDGTPTSFWLRMPKSQLAKCAEALAIRRAFPAEVGGVHTFEEMEQAESTIIAQPSVKLEDVMADGPKTVVTTIRTVEELKEADALDKPQSPQDAPVPPQDLPLEEPETPPQSELPATDKQRRFIFFKAKEKMIENDVLKAYLADEFGISSTKELKINQVDTVLQWIESQ